MSSEEIVPLLKDLGLNLYESEAYVALLMRGQLSAKELGQVTSIPQSRTYDVLSSLKERGLALITPSADRSYTPSDPSSILTQLYEVRREEIQAPMVRVQKETEQKLKGLEEIFYQAKEKLSALSNDYTRVVRNPVFVLEGYQNIEAAMMNLIDKTQSEIIRITKPPDAEKPALDPFYFLIGPMTSHLDQATSRGVKVRSLSLDYEIPSVIGLNYRDAEGFERRYLSENEELQEKFLLTDGKTALLNLRDPISKTFGSIALMLESVPTCSILGEHFELMWKRAEPWSSALKRMSDATDDVCSLMKESDYSRFEISIYRILAQNGALTTEGLAKSIGTRHSLKDLQVTVRRLIERGFLARNELLKTVLVQNPLKVRTMLGANQNKLSNEPVSRTS